MKGINNTPKASGRVKILLIIRGVGGTNTQGALKGKIIRLQNCPHAVLPHSALLHHPLRTMYFFPLRDF